MFPVQLNLDWQNAQRSEIYGSTTFENVVEQYEGLLKVTFPRFDVSTQGTKNCVQGEGAFESSQKPT